MTLIIGMFVTDIHPLLFVLYVTDLFVCLIRRICIPLIIGLYLTDMYASNYLYATNCWFATIIT